MNLLPVLLLSLFCAAFADHAIDSTEGYTLAVESNSFSVGELLDLSLIIRTEDGEHLPTDDISVYHDRYFHVIILSHDLELIYHLHPEDFGDIQLMSIDEVYNISVLFTRGGDYMVGVDFVHDVNETVSQSVTLYHTITILGDPLQEEPTWSDIGTTSKSFRAYNFTDVDRNVEVIDLTDNEDDNGYELTLVVNEGTDIMANSCSQIRWTVTGPDGNEADNLQPYLGAAAHIVAVHEERENSYYFHLHGSHENMMSMMKRDHGDMEHGACTMMDHSETPDSFGPMISTQFHFPFPGNWNIITQISVNDGSEFGKLIVAQFAVEATEHIDIEESSESAEILDDDVFDNHSPELFFSLFLSLSILIIQ